MRCGYCLPRGSAPHTSANPLRPDEIQNLCRALLRLGVRKLRLTGGEPLMRRDFAEVLPACAGFDTLALSTNGEWLGQALPSLLRHDVRHVNVSVDSLNRERFASLAGRDRLEQVMLGIDAAQAAGIKVKLNAVFTRRTIADELDAFIAWSDARHIPVRFIALMPTATNQHFIAEHQADIASLAEALCERGFVSENSPTGEPHQGPAEYYRSPRSRARIGVIAPYKPGFCSTCNRLRVTAQGALRLCLFGDNVLPLRDLLQHPGDLDALCDRLSNGLKQKPEAHPLALGRYGDLRTFSQLGG